MEAAKSAWITEREKQGAKKGECEKEEEHITRKKEICKQEEENTADPALTGNDGLNKGRRALERRPGFINDLRNLSFKNRDENKVLDAKHISAYKGRPAIKRSGPKGRSFSLWALFISPKLAAGDQYAIDVVKHEYGHTVQLKRLGLPAYLAAIGYPSMKSGLSGREYYSQPWEVTADMYGGVEREHLEGSEAAGEAYLAGKLPRRRARKEASTTASTGAGR